MYIAVGVCTFLMNVLRRERLQVLIMIHLSLYSTATRQHTQTLLRFASQLHVVLIEVIIESVEKVGVCHSLVDTVAPLAETLPVS